MGHLTLPDEIQGPSERSDNPSYLKPLFMNSVHGLDMVRFVFGNLRLVHVQRLTNPWGAMVGFAAVLTTDRGDILEFTGNWEAPANFSLTIDRPGHRLEVRPFEVATLYEGMEVTEPTVEIPIRRYSPKRVGQVSLDEVDRRFSPNPRKDGVRASEGGG